MLIEKNNPEVSIVLPCRNEEKALGFCINTIKRVLKEHNINGEIIVSDSSVDRSPEIAKKLGATLVKHNKKGYGIAYLEGFKAAKGKYLFLADADGTYDFREIPRFLNYLEKGYDFIIGNRFKGSIERKAMPWHHQYIGNPLLSGTLRLFFGSKIRDAHCGMRAITKKALDKLDLKTTGMEFASEMVIKAVQNNIRTKELPINYSGRMGKSKLSSFRDGWRHLRFMLMYAPTYLFFVPGILLFILGSIIMALFLSGPVNLNGISLYNRPMLLGSFFAILGYQIISLGVYAKTYMKSAGFIRSDKLVDKIAKFITFESGIMMGALIFLGASLLGLNVLYNWITGGFPALTSNTMVLALTLGIIGIQTMFSAFFLSILLVEKR